MPLVHVTDHAGNPQLHGGGGLASALRIAMAAKPGPVVILIHGYKYAPGTGENCPHDSLFAPENRSRLARSASWPDRLDLGRLTGPVIGYGWSARGSLWQAHRQAQVAGEGLARLILALRGLAPKRPVHILAHSMGARVALCAAQTLPNGALDRMLLLAGAEYRSAAQAAMQSSDAALFNVTSRENDLFDLLYKRLIPSPAPDDRLLGAGLCAPQAITLRLDDPGTLHGLAGLGYDIAPPQGRICHWSVYLRPGIFPLYTDLLNGTHSLQALRQACPEPAQPTPRPIAPIAHWPLRRTNAQRAA